MIELPDFAGHADALWNALLDLGETVSAEWVLVGGQMVLLHAIEHGAAWPRVSMDLDVIVNARVTASVRGFVAEIEALGFVLDGMSPELLAHRYRRGDASIDVLAPEGLGERTDLTTTPPGHTLQVPAGTRPCSVQSGLSIPIRVERDSFHGRRCSVRSLVRRALLMLMMCR
jgi:hypothetical protein